MPHQATSLLSTPHREVFPFGLLRFRGGTQPWRLKKLEVDPLLSGRKTWIELQGWKIENQDSVCFPARKSRRSSDDLQNPCSKTPAMPTIRDLILLKTNLTKSPNLELKCREMAWNLRVLCNLSRLPTWNSKRERPTVRISNHRWHQPVLLLSNEFACCILSLTTPTIFKITSEVPNKSCNSLKTFWSLFWLTKTTQTTSSKKDHRADSMGCTSTRPWSGAPSPSQLLLSPSHDETREKSSQVHWKKKAVGYRSTVG